MKYEEIIRKIFKNYKSKRELYKELDIKNNQAVPVKIIDKTSDIVSIKCKRAIDRYDMNYLNEQERNIQYEKIEYEIKREMFDYILDNNLVKIHRQLNPYENTEEFIAFLEVVR